MTKMKLEGETLEGRARSGRGAGRRAKVLVGAALAAFAGCTELEEAGPEGTDFEAEEPLEWRYSPPSFYDAVLPDDGVAFTLGESPYFTGVVAASESLAAIEGRAFMATEGKDAIDAAVVVASMLNVVEPQSSGIGGGAIWLIYRAVPNETVIVDCRERAPGKADKNMLATQSSTDLKSTSGITVGVPGSLHCMNEALRLKYAEKDLPQALAEALGPAITTAYAGFNISSRLASATSSDRLRKEPGNPAYEEARKVFRPGGSALANGAELTQTALGATLEAVADHGLGAFYDCGHPAGIASSIIATQKASRASYGAAGAGRMACSDLAAFKAVKSAPIELDYHGYKIVTSPAPTSGVHLLEMLGMLDRFQIGSSANFGFGQFYTLNVMQEAMRLAFADRAMWLGDPEFVAVPESGMLAKKYLDQRSALITAGKRRSSVSAGDPRQVQKGAAKLEILMKAAEHEGTDTTHFVTSDAAGNVVSVTTTVSDLWGTGLMVKDRGFMLNDQLLNFNDKPTAKAKPYNPGANDVAPFKRPRTTIAPTLVFLAGKPIAALGSPGGTTIINALLGFLLNLIDHRMTLQVAVAQPRFSLDSASGTASTEIETGFDAGVRSSLSKLGYSFTSASAIGAIQAAIIYPFQALNNRKYGTADPRRLGAVAGM